MTTEYERAKAGFRKALDALGMTEEQIGGLRRAADENIAELVDKGFPRAAAGALTLIAIMEALGSNPTFLHAKIADTLNQIKTGQVSRVPFEAQIGITILIETVAPDPGDMPEWGDGEGG